MQARELVNRTTNLLGTSLTAIAGFAFVPEIFLEQDRVDKIDDILLLIFGIAAIVWYKKAGNRFKRSIMPVVFTGLGLGAKILALLIEFRDKEAVGDDFGGLLVFLLSFIFLWYMYKKDNKGLVEGTPAQ